MLDVIFNFNIEVTIGDKANCNKFLGNAVERQNEFPID